MEAGPCQAATFLPNKTCQLYGALGGLVQTVGPVTQVKNCSASPPVIPTGSNISSSGRCILRQVYNMIRNIQGVVFFQTKVYLGL